MSERFEEFFDKVIDIFKEGLEERHIKENPLVTETPEFKGIIVNMPRKEKDIYHGSTYSILCNRSKTLCKIKGDLVTDSDSEYRVNKVLEESDCKIFDTHLHVKRIEGVPFRDESHIHFICQDKDREDTIRMIHLLKNY